MVETLQDVTVSLAIPPRLRTGGPCFSIQGKDVASDEEGRYRFRGLRSGRYTVWVHQAHHHWLQSGKKELKVDIAEGSITHCDVVLE